MLFLKLKKLNKSVKKGGQLKNIVYKFVLAKMLKLTQKYVLA
jgi:hypothetical protein